MLRAFVGVAVLLLVAVVVNNRMPTRHYPANDYWYRFWQRTY